jgi:cysteinyl-tRNA synthetase
MLNRRINLLIASSSRASNYSSSSTLRVGVRVRDSLTSDLVDVSGAGSVRSPLAWYACGPTVYDDAHIGHARTYVTLDMLRRAAERRASRPLHFAMGVTDIDDKIVARARADGVAPPAVAARFEASFFSDLSALGCREPSAVLRVSEHVPDVVAYARALVAGGAAYAVPRPRALGAGGDSVFLDVRALDGAYGKLAPRGAQDARPAAAGDGEDATTAWPKRDMRDFALWRGVGAADVPGSSEGWAWDSPWGLGRPGWHLECSAMTLAHFGDAPLDLHAGGVDLAFPHHCNECAQADARARVRAAAADPAGAAGPAHAAAWVKAWVHTGHVHIAGKKMSKSLKNFVTVREMLDPAHAAAAAVRDAGFAAGPMPVADAFRLWCAGHAYGASLTYAPERLGDAAAVARRLDSFLAEAVSMVARNENSRAIQRYGAAEHALTKAWAEAAAGAREAIEDDFDSPRALRSLSAGASAGAAYLSGNPNPHRAVIGGVAHELAQELAGLGLAFARTHATALTDALGGGRSRVTNVEAAPKRQNENSVAVLVALRERLRSHASAARKALKGSAGDSATSTAAATSAAAADLTAAVLAECDAIRDTALPKLGWALKDSPAGPRISALTRGTDSNS